VTHEGATVTVFAQVAADSHGWGLTNMLVFYKLVSAACLLSAKRQAGLSVLSPSAWYVLSLRSVKEVVKLSMPVGFFLTGK